MLFNKQNFFSSFNPFYRKITGKTSSSTIRSNVEFLLDEFSKQSIITDIRQIAYCFATAAHETGWKFAPIKEFRGKTLTRQQKKYWGSGYYGRGYVQLTWDYNYEKAGKKLSVDLLGNPELALNPDVAFKTMLYGMQEGWFTGQKLSNYINSTKKDYKGARKIINGTDKNALIASYAETFESILKSSLDKVEVPAKEIPALIVPDVDVPEIVPVKEESPKQEEASTPAVEASSTVSNEVDGKKTEQTTSVLNEQNVNDIAQIKSPEPYNGIGFWSTIKRDLAGVGVSNLTFQGIAEYVSQINGYALPAKLLVTLAWGVLILSVAYLVFRIIHYLIDSWKKNQKLKAEISTNTAVDKKNIEWV